MVIFGRDSKQVNSIVNVLRSKFDLKILGQTKKLLGVEFNYHRDYIEIHQSLYIDNIIAMFMSISSLYHLYQLLKVSNIRKRVAQLMIVNYQKCPNTHTEMY